MIVTNIRLQFTADNKPEYVLTIDTTRQDALKTVSELSGQIIKGKKLYAEIKPYRERRSHNANSYLWLLLSKLAAALNTTKDELYLIMLERYGVFTHVIVKPDVVDKVKSEWRTVRELGEVTIGKQKGIQLQCYFGSHTYDSKEMSVLLDGVVSECHEVGVETLTPAEISLLKSEWGKES